jgi:virginiamycin B lyase
MVPAVVLMYVTGAAADVGDITTFIDPAGNVSQPEDITTGPDGNLWFTSFGNGRVGFITPDGEITTFTDPEGNVERPIGITAGHDGNVWFTSRDTNRIGASPPTERS